MKIAFVTTQSLAGSTVVGRVLPLAEHLVEGNDVSVLVHKGPGGEAGYRRVTIRKSGVDPFVRTPSGKRRRRGMSLVLRMLLNAVLHAWQLVLLSPDMVVIVKVLPESVLATLLAQLFLRRVAVVIDVDDFELQANVLTSLLQRAAVHWAERRGATVARAVVCATPFLADHFEVLASGKPVVLIPTGFSSLPIREREVGAPILLYLGSLSVASGHRVDLLPEIVRLVRQERPVTLVLAGEGDDVVGLKAEFERLGVSEAVQWRGRFTSTQLPTLLAGASLLLDPVDSGIVARAKSSYRVMLAAACGLAVVSSDVGIRPQLLPEAMHERCFATPGDAASYAANVIAWLARPLTDEERHQLQAHAQQFSWEALGVRYLQLLHAL